jgi:hypothetical protein
VAEFSLPDFPRVDREVLREISRRHGLDEEAFPPLPEAGIFNRIYPLGEDGMILDVMRFLLRDPGEQWSRWTP